MRNNARSAGPMGTFKRHVPFFMDLFKANKTSYAYNRPLFDFDPIFERLKLSQTYKPRSSQVLDVYPNVGAWSMALNNELQPAKHLLMEPHASYLKDVQQMVEYSKDPSWIVSDKDIFFWESFTECVGEGKLLAPTTHSRDVLHPEFLITANLAYPRGDVLLLQWLQCFMNGNWAAQFGNVRMLVWCYQATATRLTQKPAERLRSKFSVVVEMVTDVNIVATTEPKVKAMHNQRFLEDNPLIIEPLALGRSQKADDLCLLDIRPKRVPTTAIDEWDYVTKQLLIVSASPLKQALANLGPAAVDYYQDKIDPALWEKKPIELTAREFIHITDIFVNWPFKPDIYEGAMIAAEE